MSKLIVVRAQAVALCEALGFATAGSWNRKRMSKKLADLAEMAEDSDISVDEDAEELNGLLKKITEAKGDVELVEKAPAVVDAPEEEVDAPEEEVDAPEEEVDAPEEETAEDAPSDEVDYEQEAEEKPKGKGGKGSKKSEKKLSNRNRPVSDAGPDLGKLTGVRSVKNRRFVAGIVIRETSLEKGVTDEMIALVDERYGQSNPAASRSQLTDAWHAINGYVNG